MASLTDTKTKNITCNIILKLEKLQLMRKTLCTYPQERKKHKDTTAKSGGVNQKFKVTCS